jgi:hypothetical protein
MRREQWHFVQETWTSRPNAAISPNVVNDSGSSLPPYFFAMTKPLAWPDPYPRGSPNGFDACCRINFLPAAMALGRRAMRSD